MRFLRALWERFFHKHVYVYRECSLHPEQWHSGLFITPPEGRLNVSMKNMPIKVGVVILKPECDDAWVCACGASFRHGQFSDCLPYARVQRNLGGSRGEP